MQPTFAATRKEGKCILTRTIEQVEEIDPGAITLYIAQEERNLADLQKRVLVSQERLAKLKEIKTEHETHPLG